MSKGKTILLVDGENFRGYIKKVFKENGEDLNWSNFNFKYLIEKVFSDTKIDKITFYFAKLKSHPETKEKSQELIEEQRLLKTNIEKQGYEVILSGRVRGQYEKTSNGKEKLVFKEKGVDVKVAVDMVSYAYDKIYDHIILGSSDSDLQPAVKKVLEKEIGITYLGFEINPNRGLMYTTNKAVLIRNQELFESAKNLFSKNGNK